MPNVPLAINNEDLIGSISELRDEIHPAGADTFGQISDIHGLCVDIYNRMDAT